MEDGRPQQPPCPAAPIHASGQSLHSQFLFQTVRCRIRQGNEEFFIRRMFTKPGGKLRKIAGNSPARRCSVHSPVQQNARHLNRLSSFTGMLQNTSMDSVMTLKTGSPLTAAARAFPVRQVSFPCSSRLSRRRESTYPCSMDTSRTRSFSLSRRMK